MGSFINPICMNSKARGILNNQWDVQNSGIALLNRSNLFTIGFMPHLLLSTVANNCLIVIATTNTNRSACGRYVFLWTKRSIFMGAIAERILCALSAFTKKIGLSANDLELCRSFIFNFHRLLLISHFS